MGTIKDAVKRECRKNGITQVDLATLCKMKTGNLSNQISRDDTVQLGLIRKICQKLSISVGSLLGEDEPEHKTNPINEEVEMIYKQLKKVLQEGDDEVVEQILGKIAREYMNVTQKKESFLSKQKLG
jgi:transcriptional regulator with XRE-family HTH domain|tara:strand:+ start:1731 stop:2111 length:381 start_codon:yes stop_codon:yes gene_type:complete